MQSEDIEFDVSKDGAGLCSITERNGGSARVQREGLS